MSTSATKPDLSELTARQRRAWAEGDYSMVASRINMTPKRPHEGGDLRARWRERVRDSRGSARC
jgi:hypothetical protein